jgi:hypothetical protein
MSRLLSTIAVSCALVASSVDAAQRTFVSVSGLDTSPSCSVVNPCRSFGKAITVTDPNGEIIALESGGYGVVTIDRSVSIIAPPGVYAGISVFAGQTGVLSNAAGVKIVLRGLFINGQGGDGGIYFDNGAELHVDNCVIANLGSHGIYTASGRIFVADTLIRNNAGSGIWVQSSTLHVDRTRIETNAGRGITGSAPGRITIRDSIIADNAQAGVKISVTGFGRADIEATTITGNAEEGIFVQSVLPHHAEVTIARSTVARNGPSGSVDGVAAANNVHMSVTDSTITGNYGNGLAAYSGATMIASNNLVTKNGVFSGLYNDGSSTFKSRGNNIVQDNFGSATNGTITSIGGL